MLPIKFFIFLIKFIQSNLRFSINVSYATYGVPSQSLTQLNLLDFKYFVCSVLRRKKLNLEILNLERSTYGNLVVLDVLVSHLALGSNLFDPKISIQFFLMWNETI